MMNNRRALIVGINTYNEAPCLTAAVADAEEIAGRLRQHQDGAPNFECRVLLDRMEDDTPISRSALRGAITELFANFKGDILLFFSGHGTLTDFGGWLCTTDATEHDWGIPMGEILSIASGSEASNVILILDCCHSGALGNPATLQQRGRENLLALLRENMTIIAASRASEPSMEEPGSHGLFTAAVLDALDGGAADHMGFVTAPSIYAYVERRFGAWDQRPVYKAHTTAVTVVRECAPLIDRLRLRQLVGLFPTQLFQYSLDPDYEPEDEHGNVHEPVNEEKVRIAQLFKEYRDAGLLKPSHPNEQLFWTARRSHTVELTARGKEYWWLVQKGKV